MTNKNIFLIAGILIIIIALVLVFTINQKQDDDIIKIGAMLILSGEGSFWGEASKNGIELSKNEINENGGINGRQVKIIYQDTKGDLKEAISIYNKFKDIDKVTAIIGPNYQSEMSVLVPLIEKDNFPIIAPSYVSKENRVNFSNPLLVWQDPSFEAQKMAEYIFNQGLKNISIIGSQDSWEKEVSTAFRDKFLELGGDVLYFELVLTDTQNMSTSVLKATSNNPDAIFIGSYYVFLETVKKLSESNYSGNIFSIEVDDYLAFESKDYSNNLVFISPDEYLKDFSEKYFNTFNINTSIPSGQAYDSANILFSILKETTNKEEIIEKFSQLKEYDGVSGKIIFTEDGKTLMPLSIYKIVDGEIVKVKNIE
jgi:branched-chain amino acid transport system substrate-binding protein